MGEDKVLGRNIENVYLLNKEMILLGDFNVDFMCTNNFSKHEFIKILTNLNMTQLVNDITRPFSKSCLDHIWCSHPERLRNVQVKDYGMSDHLPVFQLGYTNDINVLTTQIMSLTSEI